jgi:hypothetical protein
LGNRRSVERESGGTMFRSIFTEVQYLVEMRFDGSGGVMVLAVFSSTATEHSYPKAPVVINWSLI